ncbi:hypothetical protein G4228_013873 [Cervus hanglu yarkandensis]|nr:hypothetical protein G4228_013873 [Cervus hanglu yarkandensis]
MAVGSSAQAPPPPCPGGVHAIQEPPVTSGEEEPHAGAAHVARGKAALRAQWRPRQLGSESSRLRIPQGDSQAPFFPSAHRHQTVSGDPGKAPQGHERKSLFGLDRLPEGRGSSAQPPLLDGPQAPGLGQQQVRLWHWAHRGEWGKYQPMGPVHRGFGKKVAFHSPGLPQGSRTRCPADGRGAVCQGSVTVCRAILVSGSDNSVLAAWASRIASLTGSMVHLVFILMLSKIYVASGTRPDEMGFGDYPGNCHTLLGVRNEEQQPTQFINPETPGYVGFANLPNQVHRKSVKKGFEFTLMVVGESGLGKSTLINSLFLTDLYPERVIPGAAEKIERTVQIEASTVEIEERGVKLRLTVVDTPGYGDAINCRDCFKTIISYIDEQFERYLHDESGLNRRHIIDNRVHCCFYFISPFGHGLKPLDVAFMKAIHNKVNIVPVIAKADTLTLKERERLKKRILDEIEEHSIKIYHLPDAESDEDEDFKEQTRLLKASIPFSVVGSNQLIEAKGKKVRGRLYPWGVVEVENPEHNDFLKLRTMLMKVENEDMNKDQILLEKEAELRRMQEMIARMQAQMQLQLQGGDGDSGVHGHHV